MHYKAYFHIKYTASFYNTYTTGKHLFFQEYGVWGAAWWNCSVEYTEVIKLLGNGYKRARGTSFLLGKKHSGNRHDS